MGSELNEEDFKALRRIDALVDDLAAATWRFSVPESGSDLDGDDQAIAPYGHLSSLISSAMSTALSGLQGFQALWMGKEKLWRGTTFAFVHRTALLGACEAYWLLRPDDREERIHRTNHATLRAIKDELSSKTDIQTMTRLFQDGREVTDEELAQLRQRRDECARVVGRSPDTLTQMFKEAADDLEHDNYFENDDAEHLSQVFRSQWRISSADTHGRSWQHRFNDPISPDDDPESPVVQRVADTGLIIAKALTVAEIADLARQLWEQRISSPH